MSAAVAERPAARAYASYGRVYRVERAGADRMFWAVGRARGLRASFLDRLGPRQSREQVDPIRVRRGHVFFLRVVRLIAGRPSLRRVS